MNTLSAALRVAKTRRQNRPKGSTIAQLLTLLGALVLFVAVVASAMDGVAYLGLGLIGLLLLIGGLVIRQLHINRRA